METYYHWKRQYASLMYKCKHAKIKSVPKYRSDPNLLSSYPLSLPIPGYIICFTCLAITTFFYSSKVSLLPLARTTFTRISFYSRKQKHHVTKHSSDCFRHFQGLQILQQWHFAQIYNIEAGLLHIAAALQFVDKAKVLCNFLLGTVLYRPVFASQTRVCLWLMSAL